MKATPTYQDHNCTHFFSLTHGHKHKQLILSIHPNQNGCPDVNILIDVSHGALWIPPDHADMLQALNALPLHILLFVMSTVNQITLLKGCFHSSHTMKIINLVTHCRQKSNVWVFDNNNFTPLWMIRQLVDIPNVKAIIINATDVKGVSILDPVLDKLTLDQASLRFSSVLRMATQRVAKKLRRCSTTIKEHVVPDTIPYYQNQPQSTTLGWKVFFEVFELLFTGSWCLFIFVCGYWLFSKIM